MAVALASLATGIAVKPDVGMTGELTLRGKVLPIGGVKEKVLAAHRSGLKAVILPKRNELDLEDVPEDVRSEMSFFFAECVDDVIDAALESKPGRRAVMATTKTGKKASKPRRTPPSASKSSRAPAKNAKRADTKR
jgi:ATP-dependent Lon protease